MKMTSKLDEILKDYLDETDFVLENPDLANDDFEKPTREAKQALKVLFLELIEKADTATTQGGVYMVAAYDLRKKVEEL